MPAVLSTSRKVLTTSTSMEEVMSVTGTTNMKSNEVYEVGLFSFFFLVPNMVLANMNTVEPR